MQQVTEPKFLGERVASHSQQEQSAALGTESGCFIQKHSR